MFFDSQLARRVGIRDDTGSLPNLSSSEIDNLEFTFKSIHGLVKRLSRVRDDGVGRSGVAPVLDQLRQIIAQAIGVRESQLVNFHVDAGRAGSYKANFSAKGWSKLVRSTQVP